MLLLTAALAAATPAGALDAGFCSAGLEAKDRQDRLSRAARDGDPAAMYLLSEASRSPRAAEAWRRRAEGKAGPAAWIRVGQAYRDGACAPKNDAKARVMFERAARAGESAAMAALAELLEPNDPQALAWLRKAAEADHPSALVRLARVQELGPAPDLVQAEQNLKRAAALRDAAGAFQYGEFLARRGRHGEALPHHEFAAVRGVAEARDRVAVAWALGVGTAQDEEQAIAWLRAAGRSRGESIGRIGYLLSDRPEGERWLRRAASMGDRQATILLQQRQAAP